MYMPGRLRTASRPSSTVMEEAPYSGTEVPTAAWAAGSCLVVPFKGFLASFLTRTPHGHKRSAGAQVHDFSLEFGTRNRPVSAPVQGQASAPRDPSGRAKTRPR